MKKHLPDVLLVVLLALALVEAVTLHLREGEVAGMTLPLQKHGDPPGALQMPGGAPIAVKGRLAAVADYVTVEDIARGTLALERGKLAGVEPLSEAERAELGTILRETARHRQELMDVETEIARVEETMRLRAVDIARTLTPEQRAWVVAQRDQVSVNQVEKVYWDELLAAMEASP